MKKEEYTYAGEGMHHGPKVWLVFIAILLAGILVTVAFTAGATSTQGAPRISVNGTGVTPDAQLVTVSGTITKMVTPDKVDITLSVETLDVLAQKSQTDNASSADAVRKALLAAGISENAIKTVSYSVNEEYKWNDVTKISESTGYRTVNQIQVTLTDTTAAGKVVDVAVSAGANRVSSIVFGLSKERELEIRTSALTEAASVAKTKAQAIVAGLGVSIGAVHSISENSYYYTPNYANYELAKSDSVAASAPTPITAGDVEVNASVSVAFELN